MEISAQRREGVNDMWLSGKRLTRKRSNPPFTLEEELADSSLCHSEDSQGSTGRECFASVVQW